MGHDPKRAPGLASNILYLEIVYPRLYNKANPSPPTMSDIKEGAAQVVYYCEFVGPKVGRCCAVALAEPTQCGERCELHRFRESTARMCETQGCPRTLLLASASMHCAGCDPSARARRCIQNRKQREHSTAVQLEALTNTTRLREAALKDEIRVLTDRLATFVCAGAFPQSSPLCRAISSL